MKNLYFLAVAVMAVFLLFGCLGVGESGTPDTSKGGYPQGVTSAPAMGYENSGDYVSTPTLPQDKMVIKTGNAEVEVPSGKLPERYTQLKTLIAKYGGEITDSSYTETQSEKYYYITVKLDPKKFDDFGGKLADLGTVKSLSSNSEDITTQYIDITAKLENLKATRDRLLALYNRTDNISDILQLEQELTRLQYEIDSTTQQKLYYERQSAKATMTVRLVEPAPVVDRTLLDPIGQLANVFIGGFVISLSLLVGLLGFAIPAAIGIGLLYFVVKKLFFKAKKKEDKK
ncbi:MAG: DUF4349 domain-containing protein [Candidatus Micrarchaeota archaeon]